MAGSRRSAPAVHQTPHIAHEGCEREANAKNRISRKAGSALAGRRAQDAPCACTPSSVNWRTGGKCEAIWLDLLRFTPVYSGLVWFGRVLWTVAFRHDRDGCDRGGSPSANHLETVRHHAGQGRTGGGVDNWSEGNYYSCDVCVESFEWARAMEWSASEGRRGTPKTGFPGRLDARPRWEGTNNPQCAGLIPSKSIWPGYAGLGASNGMPGGWRP